MIIINFYYFYFPCTYIYTGSICSSQDGLDATQPITQHFTHTMAYPSLMNRTHSVSLTRGGVPVVTTTARTVVMATQGVAAVVQEVAIALSKFGYRVAVVTQAVAIATSEFSFFFLV